MIDTHLLRRSAALAALAAAPLLAGCVADTPDELADNGSGEAVESPEPVDQNTDAFSGGTVAQAAAATCTTGSVKGLSQQIIDEAACINADAYVAIPKLGNVTFGSSVFPYLERPARDKLVAALKAHPGTSFTVNSALRTIAQQYMLYSWYKSGRCGISLAATPGNSNHETGLALDVNQYGTWKPILQSYGFHWLGSGDPVHFDYTGSGAKSYKGLDVKAFQRLWNRNHPEDQISVDGAWGPQTEARMKKAPSQGFAKGATCGGALAPSDPSAQEAVLPPEQQAAPSEQMATPAEPMIEDLGEEVEESCSDSAL
jgi:hypothetical protein